MSHAKVIKSPETKQLDAIRPFCVCCIDLSTPTTSSAPNEGLPGRAYETIAGARSCLSSFANS